MLWQSHHFSFFLDSPLWCLPVGSRYLLWSSPIPSLPDALTTTNFAVRSSDSHFCQVRKIPFPWCCVSFIFIWKGRNFSVSSFTERSDLQCSPTGLCISAGRTWAGLSRGCAKLGTQRVALSCAGWWVKRIIPAGLSAGCHPPTNDSGCFVLKTIGFGAGPSRHLYPRKHLHQS